MKGFEAFPFVTQVIRFPIYSQLNTSNMHRTVQVWKITEIIAFRGRPGVKYEAQHTIMQNLNTFLVSEPAIMQSLIIVHNYACQDLISLPFVAS